MGGCNFSKGIKASSMRNGYNELKENAIEEYGNDLYNGTISTTNECIDVTDKWKSSKKELHAFIETMLEDCPKRTCYSVCKTSPVTNSLKIKSVVENVVQKGTTKWILKYLVETYSRSIGSYSTKTEAIKKAREYTEKTTEPTKIVMQKVREKGNAIVARISYKKDSKESLGTYYYFGVAAE